MEMYYTLIMRHFNKIYMGHFKKGLTVLYHKLTNMAKSGIINDKNRFIFNRNHDDDNNKWSDADRASAGIGSMCLPDGTG